MESAILGTCDDRPTSVPDDRCPPFRRDLSDQSLDAAATPGRPLRRRCAAAAAGQCGAPARRIGKGRRTASRSSRPWNGLPDLVFPANAAIVLDGRALVARFRHPERQGEEAVFRAAFQDLKARGLLADVIELPDGVLQEGAGDCIWDADRGFLLGRLSASVRRANSLPVIADVFGAARWSALELATAAFLSPRHLLLSARRRQGALLSAGLHGRGPGDDPRPCRGPKTASRRATRTPRPSASMPSISAARSSWRRRRTPCARKLARAAIASPKSISRRSSCPAAAPIA